MVSEFPSKCEKEHYDALFAKNRSNLKEFWSIISVIKNRKQQNTDNVHLLVENCDVMLEMLNRLNPFEPIRNPDNFDVRLILL